MNPKTPKKFDDYRHVDEEVWFRANEKFLI
jgi:hypothetical protein